MDVKLKYKSITALVEHPISFLPPGEPRVAPFMPVILTKQVMERGNGVRKREGRRKREGTRKRGKERE